MSRQLFPDELQRAEDAIRAMGPTVTLGLQPTDRYLGGELWTVLLREGLQITMGEGASLQDAFVDLHAPAAPKLESGE